MSRSHHAHFRVESDHPALAGHFPGNPVVPGVLLLDHVLVAAEAWLVRELRPAQLPQVKFVSPLLPGEDATITLEAANQVVRFRVECAQRLLAQGQFSLDEPGAA